MAQFGTSPASTRREEEGVALVLALLFSIVVIGLITVGFWGMRTHRANIELGFRQESQARAFARSGLTESINWFRRQTVQPVLAFEPQLDTVASPPVLDTDDPDIGLVREFRIAGPIWGRYEVWKPWAGDPDPMRAAFRSELQVFDSGLERGQGGGNAWLIRSTGIVFHRVDELKAFDEAPNRVLARERLDAEILRRRLAPPGQAALTVSRGDAVTVTSNGRIEGGTTGAGVYHPDATGAPVSAGVITGAPGVSTAPSIDLGYVTVFGADDLGVRGTADLIISSLADFPVPLQRGRSVFSEVSLVFDSATPLTGNGLVVVQGDVLISAGSNSSFSGLLYVDGDLTVQAPAQLEGAVVCTGQVRIEGSGDQSVLRFDDGVLTTLRADIDAYRFLGSFRLQGREGI